MPSKRIIIKVGSAVLLNKEGFLSNEILKMLANEIAKVRNIGYDVILVTSGAVACGTSFVRKHTSKGLRAAIGQPLLMKTYKECFSEYSLNVAQYLITREYFSDRKRYLWLKSSFEEAFKENVLPIINDNDLFHEETDRFSDNDQLACYLGIMMMAEKVIILTSVDGIFTDFGTEKQKKIDDIYNEKTFDTIDTNGKTNVGTGGMEAKLRSIRLAMNCGVDTVIVNGKLSNPLSDIFSEKKNYTTVHGIKTGQEIKGIKKWLLAGANPKGVIIISDQGASSVCNRLERKSVLAKGVLAVHGIFEKGDVIQMKDENGILLAYGITKMSSQELDEKKGVSNLVAIHADYILILL